MKQKQRQKNKEKLPLQNNKAVLVAAIYKDQSREQAKEYLEELNFLARTYGIESETSFVQKMYAPDKSSFVGNGKLEEIKAYIDEHQIANVVFDDDLSPSQVRNLEKKLQCTILDRGLLIINIFQLRAKTAQAKTQVELARTEYLLPRLRGMWTHLERQRGGTGTRGGAGEKEIETDRRILRDKIALLKKKLDKIKKQSDTQKKNRSQLARVALVGYTNAGKSTLMKLLSGAELFSENKLFATVDTTVRKVVWDNIPFLLSDTVGFIRKLPHALIESFKSTLDEVKEADVLLHVVDISHNAYEEQINTVNQTLQELDASDKEVILVLNKIDQVSLQNNNKDDPEESAVNGNNALSANQKLDQLKEAHFAKNEQSTVLISAENKINIDELKETLLEKIKKKHYEIYPNYLKQDGEIE